MDLVTIQWVLGGFLSLLFVTAAVGNAVILVRAAAFRRNTPSFLPIVGGLAGALALVVLPVGGVAKYCWVPLLLDFGCVPSIACAVIGRTMRRQRTGEDGKDEGGSANAGKSVSERTRT